MKKRKSILFLTLIMFITVSVAFIPGCKESEKMQKPEIIKIGAILPLTGNLAFIGKLNKNGMDLAVEDINSRGGMENKKIQVIYEDSKSSSAEGVSAINKLITIDKINVIIVSTTNIAIACAPVAEKSNIIEIVMSPQPGIATLGANIFRIFPNSRQEAEILAKHISDKGIKKVALLNSQDDYGTACAESFESHFKQYGGDIVSTESYTEGQQDLKPQILNIKHSAPESIVLFGFGRSYPAILKQLKEQSMNLEIFGNLSFNNTPIKEISPEEIEGVVFTVPAFNLSQLQTEKNAKYIKKYLERYKNNPDHSSAYFYDAVVLLTEAINNSGNGVESIKEELLKTKNFQGITGNISIEPNGDSKTSIRLATYRDGKIELMTNK